MAVSRTWVTPRWWPRDRDDRAVVGFKFEFWFFPERDQWQMSLGQERRILSIGPLRFTLSPIGINRAAEPKRSE